MRHLTGQRGLTLIELMVGLAIGTFLMLSAAPYFSEYSINSRLREGGNLVYSEALLAQSEAIKRNAVVRLSTDGTSVQVIDRSVPATPVVLRTRALSGGVTAATGTVDFGSEGRPVPFGTAVSINLATSAGSCSSDMRCPGLRVDAGGAIRLCGNQLSSDC
jgi:type IV fimbrial biogenesis protein FimT